MVMQPRRIIRFDEQFLRTLVDQKDSGVTVKKTRQHLLLRPIHLNNVEDSLKGVLRYGIAKYNKDLKGILLGFKDVKLLNSLGVISNDSSGVHVDVSANFFVFEPEINAEMQGTVVRKSKDHIGVLVYKSFNVSIPKQHDDEVWMGTSVNLGDEVKLSITYTDFTHHLPYIRGTLLSIVSRNPNPETKTKPVKTKSVNRKIKFDEDGEALDQNVSHIDETIESVIKGSTVEETKAPEKKSKAKKRKKIEESANDELIDSLLAQVKEEVSEKSKKRKKKQVADAVISDDGAIDQNVPRIDEASESFINEDVAEKLDKSTPQIKQELLENMKKKKSKLIDDTTDQNVPHIYDVSESVADKELEWNVQEGSKGKKRKLSESGNVLIDSLLAQVKDEVLEKPRRKKKKLQAEPESYDDDEASNKLKNIKQHEPKDVDEI